MLSNILLIILNINVFLIMLIMLAIYGKANEIIERATNKEQAIIDLITGFIKGFTERKGGE